MINPIPLSSVRKAVIEAVPEIVELKFGCRILFEGATYPITYVGRKDEQLHYIKMVGTDEITYIGDSALREKKILGRPIRLADVLVLLKEKYGTAGHSSYGAAVYAFLVGDEKPSLWNLLDDDLEKQTPECITFLAKLLR